MNRAIRLTCLIALPLALAACGKKEPEAEEKAEAAGEILPGSIDDAMLPMDSLRSQPPLAPRTDPAAKASAAKTGPDDPAEASGEASGATATGDDDAPVVSIPTASPAATPAATPKAR